MKSFPYIIQSLRTPMAVVLPLWLTVGRMLLGTFGWVTMIALPGIIILFFLLLFIPRRAKKFSDGINKPVISLTTATILAGLYASIFIAGIFIVDGGDTEGSVGSVASRIFGKDFIHLPDIFTFAPIITSAVLFVVLPIHMFRESSSSSLK